MCEDVRVRVRVRVGVCVCVCASFAGSKPVCVKTSAVKSCSVQGLLCVKGVRRVTALCAKPSAWTRVSACKHIFVQASEC